MSEVWGQGPKGKYIKASMGIEGFKPRLMKGTVMAHLVVVEQAAAAGGQPEITKYDLRDTPVAGVRIAGLFKPFLSYCTEYNSSDLAT